MRRRRDLEPFGQRGRHVDLGAGDLPLLFMRLVRRGRGGALMTACLGAVFAGIGGPWNGLVYPWGLFISVGALGLGVFGTGLGTWFLFKPHPLAEIPSARKFAEQLAATAHPFKVCTRCRRILEHVESQRCDRCLSIADLFTARSTADHRVILATLPKDIRPRARVRLEVMPE